MAKIYLPTEYLNKPCYVINNGYIRVYNTTNNSNNIVYDIYINQDYQVRRTTSGYSSSTQCDTMNQYTDDIYYRTDFDKILVIFLILCIFCFLLPLKIFVRFFRRFQWKNSYFFYSFPFSFFYQKIRLPFQDNFMLIQWQFIKTIR